MRTLNIILIALTMLVSASAMAANPTDRDVMTDALKSIDTVPTRPQVTERFPHGEALLVTIATDTDETLYVRKRATTFLSMYRTVEAAQGLETIARDEQLRPYAVYTLARSFGDTANAELVAKVAAYLDDDSEKVREWAVRGLRWMRHDDARTVLQKVAAGDADADLESLASRSLKKWKPAKAATTR